MAIGKFSSTEWKQLVNAPQLIYHLLTATDRGTILTRRSEAKALQNYLSSHRSQSALVRSIIAGQKDADDKIDASPEEAQRMLQQVGALLEAKADDIEGDAIRDFLLDAGEAIAEASREQGMLGSKRISTAEQETLAAIASALKATDADKRRRHEAAVAAEARKQAEEQELKAKREADARQKAEEQARIKREAEAQERLEALKKKREAQAQKAKEDKARHEAEAKKAEEDKARRETEAKKAEEDKARREVEAMKREARDVKREAQTSTPAAQAIKPAAQAAEAEAETIYVVKRGDTLSGIAKSVYGNAGRWREIFEANKDIIENPNLIRPGWKLRIPD